MLFENLSGAIWELWSHDSNNTFFWRIDSFSLYNFRILSIKYLVNCKPPLPSKCNPLLFSWLLFMFPFSVMSIYNSSVIGQKDESQKGGFKKTKHAKFSEKRIFLTLWYAQVRVDGIKLHMLLVTVLHEMILASADSQQFLFLHNGQHH